VGWKGFRAHAIALRSGTERQLNPTERLHSSIRKRRATAPILAAISILANLEWVSLPFSFYGLRGRPGVLYGEYTLLRTFYFHPTGYFWWGLMGLQVLATLLAVFNARLSLLARLIVFIIPAAGLLALDVYFVLRGGNLNLWSMYAVGVVAPLLLVGSGFCYAKSD
jgi:hypothetical protein